MVALGMLVALGASIVMGQPPDPLAEQALKKGTSRSWYDPSKPEDERIIVSGPAERETLDARSDQIAQPVVAKNWNWNFGFWQVFGDALAYVFLGLVVIGILVTLFIVAYRSEAFGFTPRTTRQSENKSNQQNAKITDLPFQLEKPVDGFLAAAQESRDRGDFSRAMVYLYSHVLLELDKAHRLRLMRGKTNRMYLRELQRDSQIKQIVGRLVVQFERVFFGRVALTQTEFNACWNELPTLESLWKQPLESVDSHSAIHEENSNVISIRPDVLESPMPSGINQALLIGLLFVAGCGWEHPLPSDDYGKSRGVKARNSLSGLSVFRSMCEGKGHRTYSLTGLTQRAMSMDVLVWAPYDFEIPSVETLDWFELWLASNPDRTLVLIGRDYSAVQAYWKQAAERAQPSEKLIYQNEAALEHSAHEERSFQAKDHRYARWFVAESNQPKGSLEEAGSEWADDWNASESHIPIATRLLPIDHYPKDRLDDLIQASDAMNTTPANVTIVGKASKLRGLEEEKTFPKWQEDQDFVEDYQSQPLLTEEDGRPFIFRLSSIDWDASQVIVMGNGAPLLNYGLAHRAHRSIAFKVMSEFSAKGKVGFLEAGSSPRIVDFDEEFAGVKGFEMLTVWPINLVSLHAAILGIVVLSALFPIFGRAKSLPQRSTQDFGQHIEALGDLLYATRDRAYASKAIAHYFREVRNEPGNPWSSVEQTTAPVFIESNTASGAVQESNVETQRELSTKE